jgi:hypothetical protein
MTGAPGIRRYEFLPGGVYGYDEAAVDGWVGEVVVWGETIVAIVRLEDDPEGGWRQELHEITTSPTTGRLQFRRLAEADCCFGEAQARGPLLALNHALPDTYISVLQMALPVSVLLPDR